MVDSLMKRKYQFAETKIIIILHSFWFKLFHKCMQTFKKKLFIIIFLREKNKYKCPSKLFLGTLILSGHTHTHTHTHTHIYIYIYVYQIIFPFFTDFTYSLIYILYLITLLKSSGFRDEYFPHIDFFRRHIYI